jgi:hypothetical protein
MVRVTAVMPPNASGRNTSVGSTDELPISSNTTTARLTAATTPATASTNNTTSHRVPRRASSWRAKKSMGAPAAAGYEVNETRTGSRSSGRVVASSN